MRVLVTGCSGMIGSALCARLKALGYEVIGMDITEPGNDIVFCPVDMADRNALEAVIEEHRPDRIIHLAALAHDHHTKEEYLRVNVDCARNVFEAAGNIPVLFISTVDVLGFTQGIVTPHTQSRPVSHYGISKAEAEKECRRICPHFDIMRFSPVYTETVKRDIEKRYYLRYPDLAYIVGRGTEYEVLNIEKACDAMAEWLTAEPAGSIRIIKDDVLMNTADCIRQERSAGRAKRVLHFPRWCVFLGYRIIVALLGQTPKTYLLNKAVYPVRSKNIE